VTSDSSGELRFAAVEPSGPVRCRAAGFDVTLRLVEIPVAVSHG
jgi:hypothetical protein